MQSIKDNYWATGIHSYEDKKSKERLMADSKGTMKLKKWIM